MKDPFRELALDKIGSVCLRGSDEGKKLLLAKCHAAAQKARDAALEVIQGAGELTAEEAWRMAYSEGILAWHREWVRIEDAEER